jgi:hypothetical protein
VIAYLARFKGALLVSAGLAPASRWWVKAVAPAGPPARAGRVQGTGFAGRLGPAPPVHAPGGPVLLADDPAPSTPPPGTWQPSDTA